MLSMPEMRALDWLLEPEDIGPRYLAMRELASPGPDELRKARIKAHRNGPIAHVLDRMNSEGYWVKPKAGYSPKYTGTVWSIILLSQLGASIEMDTRLAAACDYLVEHALTPGGQFSVNGTPSGTIDCLQGNLCAALLDLGYPAEKLQKAFEWMARSVTGEGVAPAADRMAPVRYYAYQCGPGFACGPNNKLPCAWGAAKIMLAFCKLPASKRTAVIDRAIQAGVDFLFSIDPATADYPCGYADKPSSNWWKFGFPVFYITDILQIAEALAGLGYGRDSRLSNTLKLIESKQDINGCWALEYNYTGDKVWLNFGPKNKPSKWVTIRALKTLKLSGQPYKG
ncbi:MAG: nitrogen fixation protein NifH [Dehalococcoidaceae bacterium]|nr:nitrogen fixation protein NifH [Dehalococcoidaceae bacterium]